MALFSRILFVPLRMEFYTMNHTSIINFKAIEHIIWDYNGTLLNDVHICVSSINQLLVERDIQPVDEFGYKDLFGFPVRDYYQKIGFDFQKESFEYVGEMFVELYNQKSLSCDLHQNVRFMLNYFNQMGKKQYVLSARQEDSLEDELRFHGIAHYFTRVYGLKDLYAYGKTDLGLQMMQELNLEPEKTILVGDTCHDAEVAHAMGIQSVLLSHGHHLKSRLESCGRTVYDTLDEFRLKWEEGHVG